MSYGQNTQNFNAKKFKRVEKEISAQRKQLEELRLQDESQNTRLLKIQQKERGIDNEYKDRKKKMEDTMEVLGFEAEKFNEEQKRMNQDLESKRDALVMTNDRKKKQEEDRLLREQKLNAGREIYIDEAKKNKEELEVELQELIQKTDQYRQYEDFLKSVLEKSEDFSKEEREGENGVKQIIDRYDTLKQKEKDFKNERDRIESQKDEINKDIIRVKKQIEDETLKFNSQYQDMKVKIDELNTYNRQLEGEIEGKLNENNNRQTEFAQIIMAIRNLHTQIRHRQEEDSHIDQKQGSGAQQTIVVEEIETKNHQIFEKLNFIRDRLKYLLGIKESWEAHCKEKGISSHFHHH